MARPLGLGYRWLLPAAAALLLGDTFAPWQSTSVGSFAYSWNVWHGDKGVPLGMVAAALVSWATASALRPALPARAAGASISLALAAFLLALALVKNVRDDDS